MKGKPPEEKFPYAEGPIPAKVMLVGQNPGKEEALVGRPFVGRSGKFLNHIFKKNGLDRSRFYITPLVKETTPHNRKPRANEIKRWLPVLVKEIKRVRPEMIVLLGRIAWRIPRYDGIEYIETYHPAAAMRFPKIREKFENDMKKLSRKISDTSR
ncbi:MAG: uracil-DNA glycosylase [Deltaproteobacteria bacterium]|nr:uracil-DNA glycosylase [Deltaproteobacteria bacterium]